MSQSSHHEYQSRSHENVEGSTDRSFGLVFAVVFGLFAGLSLWRGGSAWPILAAVSSVFVIVSLVRPAMLAPLNKLWMRVGLVVAAIMNPIVLGLLFYGGFTLIALIARMVGKNFLSLRRQPDVDSYWITRAPPGPEPTSMKDQF